MMNIFEKEISEMNSEPVKTEADRGSAVERLVIALKFLSNIPPIIWSFIWTFVAFCIYRDIDATGLVFVSSFGMWILCRR